jgi:hypothetical protein
MDIMGARLSAYNNPIAAAPIVAIKDINMKERKICE